MARTLVAKFRGNFFPIKFNPYTNCSVIHIHYSLILYFVIKDIIVKIAKIDNQEMHGKMLNFAPFNNSV